MSVGVRQHTQVVRGCLWLSVSTHRTYVAVRVCPSAHTDVRGCPSAQTGSTCVSFSTHRTSVAVCVCPCVSVCVHVCPSEYTGRSWLSISTHISMLVLGLSTLALPVECSGDFGPRGLSVQYTKDVRGCPPAHTERLWLSVSTHRTTHRTSVAVRVCPSAHTGRPWLSISTDIRTLVLGLSTLALPVDCLGDFGPRGLFVQYTQDVRGCPPAHTDRPWLSVAVRQHTQDVCGCPCVSVCVRQHTQDVCGCPLAQTGRPCVSISTHRTSVCVRVCPSALAGRPWLSISTHISTLVLGLSTLALPVDCLGDFAPRGLSVQYTQDIRGCSPAHRGRLLLSVSTHRTYVAVRSCLCVCPSAHTQDICGCPLLHISARWSLDSPCWPFPWTVWVILAHVGYLLSTHRISVGVRQHTQVVRGCLWLSVSTHRTYVAVRVCPSAHTGRPWVSVSTNRTTHISMLVLGLSTLALPVECSGDFGPRGLSVQYTQDVRGCPPAHTGRLWLSVAVCQHTQDVRGCLCVSVSTHRTSVAVHYTLARPMDCLGDFGPCGLSVQYTQEVRACPSAHTGRPCVSVSTHRTSVCVRQHTQDVRGCPSVHISARCTHRTSVGVRQHTQDVRGGPWLSVSTQRTSVAVCVCPCVSVSTPRTSTETRLNGWSVLTNVSIVRLKFATLMREICDRIDTSNTSPDSCVIDVKVGIVCGPIQSDATAHDHLDALILPASQVSNLC
ncbi:hypothetical protein YC2023_066275 [Brassica napus]